MMNEKLTHIDLFSGIGGFSKGLQDAGLPISKTYFSEVDKYAITIYKKQFPKAEYLGGVESVSARGFKGRNTIITFGFPCQDLSIAGKRKGFDGSRSSLFFEAMRIIGEIKPRLFIFENVKGFYSSNNGKDFQIALQTIADLGLYECQWQLLNTAWFLPQNRERIYFVGSLRGKPQPQIFPIRKSNKRDSKKISRQQFIRGRNKNTSGCLDTRGVNAFDKADLDKIIYPSFLNKKGEEIATQGITLCLTCGAKSGGNHSDMTLIADYRKDEGIRIRKNNISPSLCARARNDGNGQPIVIAQRGRENGQQLEKRTDGLTNTLTSVQKDNFIYHSSIRRLTPIECERLQGFPEIEQIINIEIRGNTWLLEHQKNYVNVVNKNHKKQSFVGNVEKIEKPENVKYAENNLSLKTPPIKKLAQKSVPINLEGLIVVIHNQKKSQSSADIAETIKRSVQHIKIDYIVQLIVGISTMLEEIMLIGKVESHQKEPNSIHQKNGNTYVKIFGQEITQLVKNAEKNSTTLNQHLKSIISDPLNMKNIDTISKTLCWFANLAIGKYIKKETRITIQLIHKHGWTKYGHENQLISDTQRYKTIGNAVSVPVVKAIGERLLIVT